MNMIGFDFINMWGMVECEDMDVVMDGYLILWGIDWME